MDGVDAWGLRGPARFMELYRVDLFAAYNNVVAAMKTVASHLPDTSTLRA